jgi:hypothetical protein
MRKTHRGSGGRCRSVNPPCRGFVGGGAVNRRRGACARCRTPPLRGLAVRRACARRSIRSPLCGGAADPEGYADGAGAVHFGHCGQAEGLRRCNGADEQLESATRAILLDSVVQPFEQWVAHFRQIWNPVYASRRTRNLMKYYLLSPEVAGGLGPNTVMSQTVHPPEVARLHYHMEGWLGDELLESFPCFVVTQRLADAIKNAQLTGVGFGDVEVTLSEQFRLLYPDRELPRLAWLKIVGKVAQDDLGMDKRNRLVASEVALQVFKAVTLENCAISEFEV